MLIYVIFLLGTLAYLVITTCDLVFRSTLSDCAHRSLRVALNIVLIGIVTVLFGWLKEIPSSMQILRQSRAENMTSPNYRKIRTGHNCSVQEAKQAFYHEARARHMTHACHEQFCLTYSRHAS
ncbi:hypothetical protein RRG08_044090 [Elysia crispata]|uniref:Uncharacterized protein n=1 Tax=Elysia crispata TaxID=231223 RepID=A0AAE1DB90_9GAST|nr:hypothetical protein RRG08_044090 [Elysia crispata]